MTLFSTLLLIGALSASCSRGEPLDDQKGIPFIISHSVFAENETQIAADLFFSKEANPSLEKKEKIAFYTAFSQETTESLSKRNFHAASITYSCSMPVVTLHYSNHSLAEIQKDIERFSYTFEAVGNYVVKVRCYAANTSYYSVACHRAV